MRAAFALAALLLAAPAAQASRPVLVEMFVSQSCSSCPPANALLQALAARNKNILPLSLDVTYWNYLEWKDTDSMDAATARQYWYAGLPGGTNVYTPEAVVDGTAQMVGSDAKAVHAAIAAAWAAPAGDVPLTISGGAKLNLRIGPGTGAGEITLFGYDPRHATPVAAGENGGTVITEINVVRSITPLGAWDGTPRSLSLPRPAGLHMALLLQAKDGAVLGLTAF